jgi:adenylate cyclase
MDSDVHAWAKLISCYRALGDEAAMRDAARSAVAQAELVLAHDPSNGAAMSFGARGYAAVGEDVRAREWMDRALLIDPENLEMRYNLACMLATELDDANGAMTLLDRFFRKAGALRVKVAERDPDLEGLRDDPRFERMLAAAKSRLGLPDLTGAAAVAELKAVGAAAPLRSSAQRQ